MSRKLKQQFANLSVTSVSPYLKSSSLLLCHLISDFIVIHMQLITIWYYIPWLASALMNDCLLYIFIDFMMISLLLWDFFIRKSLFFDRLVGCVTKGKVKFNVLTFFWEDFVCSKCVRADWVAGKMFMCFWHLKA